MAGANEFTIRLPDSVGSRVSRHAQDFIVVLHGVEAGIVDLPH